MTSIDVAELTDVSPHKGVREFRVDETWVRCIHKGGRYWDVYRMHDGDFFFERVALAPARATTVTLAAAICEDAHSSDIPW